MVQELAPEDEEYFPLSHSEHDAADPFPYFPGVQPSHTVSCVGVLAFLILVPVQHVELGVQLLAPSEAENLAFSHGVHSVCPPTEYVPARHFSTSVRPDVGFFPAGANLQVTAPSVSEYSPAPEQ